jgi:hypothetical protein
MGATPVLSLPNGLKLPKVSGTGLSAVDFQNLTNCNSPSELFKLLLSMDLGKVASTISLDQLTQLANQFGSDLSFQSLLNTGRLPEPISAPPSTLSRPTVKGLGLDGNSFSALLNAKDSSSLFKEISAQTLDQIASHISQTQLNQIFTKFEADPAFGNFITTGTMPKALNAVEPINTTPSHPPEVELIGTLSV